MNYRSYTLKELVTDLNDQWVGYLDNKAAGEAVWVEAYMAAIEALAAEVDLRITRVPKFVYGVEVEQAAAATTVLNQVTAATVEPGKATLVDRRGPEGSGGAVRGRGLRPTAPIPERLGGRGRPDTALRRLLLTARPQQAQPRQENLTVSILSTHTDRVARQVAQNATTRELGDLVNRYRSQHSKPALKLDGLTGTDPTTLAARRHVIYLEQLHIRAGREHIARSMSAEDLADMLPDFGRLATLCGVPPQQAEANRRIVIDELRRRSIAAE